MYIYKDEMQTYGHMERRRDQKADDFKKRRLRNCVYELKPRANDRPAKTCYRNELDGSDPHDSHVMKFYFDFGYFIRRHLFII